MYLSVQKLHPSAKLPLRATKDSAGCDLYACLDKPLTIATGEIAKIPTGLAVVNALSEWLKLTVKASAPL